MITVLYVDDEESLLDIGKKFLERTGTISVVTTPHPSDVLRLLSTDHYDAVISDYQMPDKNGIDLLKEVRQQIGDIPFILFTGRGREEVVIQAINNGADFYLQKGGDLPSLFAELEHKIKQAVSKKQAEKSLQSSNEELIEASSRYKALIAASNTGAWEYHADTGFLWCSPEYFSMLGRDINDLSGKQTIKEAWIDLLHPDDQKKAYQQFKSYLQTPEGIYEQYFRMLHHDGHWVWIWSRGKTLRDTAGNATPVTVGTHIDVTERKLVEEALLLDESRLEALLELNQMIGETLDTITHYIMEKAVRLTESTIGYVAFVNEDESVLTMHAWSRAAMQECMIQEKPIVYPVATTGLWGECIRQRCPVITNDYEAPSSLKKGIPDGHVHLKRHLNVPFFDGDKIVMVTGVGNKKSEYGPTDIRQLELLMGGMWTIIQRKKAEDKLKGKNDELQAAYEEISATDEELRSNLDELIRQELELSESKRDLADIINFLPDATFAIDLAGTVITWNRAMEEMTGVPADHIIGKANYEYALPFYNKRRPILIDLIFHDDQAVVAQYPYITKRGKSLFSEVFIPHFKNGRGAHLWFTACPLYDTNGVLKGAIESIRDITERKVAEEALKQDEYHLKTLVRFYQMTSLPLQELLTFAIEKAVEITDSTIGYLAFVSDDETVLTMYAWSAQSMKECAIKKKPLKYPMDSTGLWGEAVRQRCPVITNDYAADNPLKKGYPVGHVPIIRHMNIPVFNGTHIVMVAGVGNKASLYDERDVQKLTLLMSGLWNVIEKSRAEEALKKSEEKFRQIVENSHDIIYTLTADGIFTFVSPAWTTFLGHQVSEVVGKSFQQFIHPDDIHKCLEFLHFVIHLGKNLSDIEYRVQHKNGTWLWHTSSAVPLRDKKDIIIGFYGIARDITEKKRTEKALQESEQKYRNVVEDQTELICRFLPDGTHVFVNDAYCKYFDKKREEIIGHRFKPVIYPEDKVTIGRQIASLTPKNPIILIDQRIIMPDGSIRWQRWSDRAIFDENGFVKEYQSVGRDITEQKIMETQLALANKKLNLLSGITRHDISNQLTALAGYTDLLNDTDPDSPHREYYQKILTIIGRISFLIEFTREYEEMGIHTPLWQDLRGIVEIAENDAPLGDVRVKNELPKGIEIFADPLITRVFYNLMDNAVQYGVTITTIRFSVNEKESNHILICEDDGNGVPYDMKEKIFERGFGKNTGLGLFLSREILQMTGITIRETGEPGKGARFEMILPKEGWRTTGLEQIPAMGNETPK